MRRKIHQTNTMYSNPNSFPSRGDNERRALIKMSFTKTKQRQLSDETRERFKYIFSGCGVSALKH